MGDVFSHHGAGYGMTGGMAFGGFAADFSGGDHALEVFGKSVVGIDAAQAALVVGIERTVADADVAVAVVGFVHYHGDNGGAHAFEFRLSAQGVGQGLVGLLQGLAQILLGFVQAMLLKIAQKGSHHGFAGNLPAVLPTHAVGQHVEFVPGRKHQIAQCILLFFALADVLALVEINLHKCCSLMAA